VTELPEDDAQPDTPRTHHHDDETPMTSRRDDDDEEVDSATPPDGISIGMDAPTEPAIVAAAAVSLDLETTLNLTGDGLDIPLRDDARDAQPDAEEAGPSTGEISREHLKGLLEALIFASDKPIRAAELAKSAAAPLRDVKLLLAILKSDYSTRGVQLDEVAGGWIFRTSAAYAPFVRDLTKQKPVKLTRAQIETLAILAYRQPITRPEIDEIRGVDSGPVLKLLLERDLVKILGKKDEPGRPLLYGTTPHFLEFFGLKSLKELPTLREFTELNEDSRRVVERELGDVFGGAPPIIDERGDRGMEESPVTHRVDPDARDLRASIPGSSDSSPVIMEVLDDGGDAEAAALAEADEAARDVGSPVDADDEITEIHREPRPEQLHDEDEPDDEPRNGRLQEIAIASHTEPEDDSRPEREDGGDDLHAPFGVDSGDEPPPTRIEPIVSIPRSTSEPREGDAWEREGDDAGEVDELP